MLGSGIGGYLVGLLAAMAQPMLSNDVLGRLVVMQDRVFEGVMVRQLAPVGLAVGVGGVDESARRSMILLLDAPPGWPPSLPQAATPYFALSPDGRQVAYWRHCPVEGAEQMGELVALDLWSGDIASLSPPQVLGDGGGLCWPLPSNLVFSAARPLPSGNWGLVWRLDVGSGQSFCLLERPPGTAAGRLYPSAAPHEVLYADALGAVVLPVTGAESSATDLGPVLWRHPGGESWLSLSPRVELHTTAGVAASLDLRGNAAAWAPGGAAAMIAAGGKLHVAPADLSFSRELTGWAGRPEEFTHLLWRGTVAEAAAATLAPRPALHLFALGTEHVTASIFFPAQGMPELGARVWIARDFEVTATGAPIKPLWPTLKACFSVVRAQPMGAGVLVEAQNSGTQAGVLERVVPPNCARSSESEIATMVGGKRVVWVERWELAGRGDVRGWIDGVPALGIVRALRVERRRLDAP